MINVRFPKTNLHTHSSFCDGRQTPEQIVQAAIRQGLTGIGFSSHSPIPYENDFAMTEASIYAYREEIKRLKRAYAGQINVFLGIEQDYLSGRPYGRYDYVIGSVHTMMLDGRPYELDNTKEELLRTVNEQFRGDIYLLLQHYFKMVGELVDVTDCNIIGHFDLVTKNNEKGHFIDTASKAYLDCGLEAIHALKGKIPFFEVNTGAIARGYRTSPYPQMEFLKEFKRCGFGVVITSDCHNKTFLDCIYKEAAELVAQAGFRSKWILTGDGFREVAL